MVSKVSVEDESSQSVKERVYGELKLLILQNRLRPGAKLGHDDLSRRLNSSRTPVREALERLSQERYVTLVPNRGFFVTEMDITTAGELYSMREALEVHALSLSMHKGFKPKELRQMEVTVATYLDLIESGEIERRRVLDRDFHMALASRCGNSYLLETLANVFDKLLFKFRAEGYHHLERGLTAAKEHALLLAAVRKGNEAEATRILREHIRSAWAGFRKYLESLDKPH